MFRRLTIELTEEEFLALQRLAQVHLRSLRSQARFTLREQLLSTPTSEGKGIEAPDIHVSHTHFPVGAAHA